MARPAQCALGTSRKWAWGPLLCQGPRPASWRAPQALLHFSGGSWSCIHHPNTWAISLPTAQHVMAVSGVSTMIRGWTQPTETGPWSWHVLAAASMQNGQGWASEEWGRHQRLETSQLVLLEDAQQDQAVHTSRCLHRYHREEEEALKGEGQAFYKATQSNNNTINLNRFCARHCSECFAWIISFNPHMKKTFQ